LRTTSVRLNEVSIVLDDGGTGAALLLLHGFPATRALWASVAPALCELGFRVLVPDLVGYGASEAPPGLRLDMASQARWMLQLLDAVGVGRVVVVAHDVGSAAAQLLLATAPERLRGLAILDGVYAGEWAMAAIASIRAWDPADAARLFPLLARRLGKSDSVRALLAPYQGEHGGRRLIRAARDLDPSQTEPIGETLRRCGVPALVVWGEHDQFLPIDTVARPLAELLQAPLLLVPGGHFTPLDCPLEVVAALRNFLASLS
jgi:pimeloyl-ACP methyl ester carboxylesterase